MDLHPIFLCRELYKTKIGFVFFNIILKIIIDSVYLPQFFSLTVPQKAFHVDISVFTSFFFFNY